MQLKTISLMPYTRYKLKAIKRNGRGIRNEKCCCVPQGTSTSNKLVTIRSKFLRVCNSFYSGNCIEIVESSKVGPFLLQNTLITEEVEENLTKNDSYYARG